MIRNVMTMVAVLGAVFALGTAGAQASLVMPQSWEFGTDEGLDPPADFTPHRPEGLTLQDVGLDMQRRGAITTEFSDLGAGQNENFTVRALADFFSVDDDDDTWSSFGIAMLGTYAGDKAIWTGSDDTDYLIFGVNNAGSVRFWEGSVLAGTTEVGDITGLMETNRLQFEDGLIELLVNAVYDEGSGTVNFDWTVTLNGNSISSDEEGQDGFTVDMADYDGQRFGYGIRAAQDHVANLREFEVIPEPATLALLGLGGLGIFLKRRNRG